MNYLQSTIIPDQNKNKLKSNFLNYLLNLNILALIITFVINFLGLPILKYHYVIHVAIAIAGVFFFDLIEIFPIILTLFFLEGQGRIIWEYNSWSRIIFDLLISFSVLKIFISRGKIIDFEKNTTPFVLMIILHFLSYLLQFSNINAISYFVVLASAKLYVLPIFAYLALVQIDFDIYSVKFQKTLNFIIFLIFLEVALAFYQMYWRESLMLHISPYYSKAMKDGIFTGIHYRPFGTSQLPGAISGILFLTVGFLYLKKSNFFNNILRHIVLVLMGIAIGFCQVRSAFIKFILIIVAIRIGELIYSRFGLKDVVGIFVVLIIFIGSVQLIIDSNSNTGNLGIDYARDRFITLTNYDKISSSRINTNKFFTYVIQNISDHPFGISPGLTGAIRDLGVSQMDEGQLSKLQDTWASDNLFISLSIDFGIFAIFYIAILFYIPFYFIRFLIEFYRKKDHGPYTILLVCFSSVSVIIIGNWGAIGLTYNPESFIFWFFSALGFSTIAKYKLRNLNIENF